MGTLFVQHDADRQRKRAVAGTLEVLGERLDAARA
jgi:hypothetical protein